MRLRDCMLIFFGVCISVFIIVTKPAAGKKNFSTRSLPLMDKAFGELEFQLGAHLASMEKELRKIGKKEMTDDMVSYIITPESNYSSSSVYISHIKIDFENEILTRVKIFYQIMVGWSDKKLTEFEKTLHEILGPADGYVLDDDGRAIKTRIKDDILIGTLYNDVILWYIIVIYKNMGNVSIEMENRIVEGYLSLSVKDRIQVPMQILKLLNCDISGISPDNPASLDRHFADKVILGPGFYMRYMRSSHMADNSHKALFRLKSGTPPNRATITFEGRVLLGVRRAIPLIMDEFESIIAKFRVGEIRNATKSERELFYMLIDFEISGLPVYIIESQEGRLLIFLEKNERIKWIEYLDSWVVVDEGVFLVN